MIEYIDRNLAIEETRKIRLTDAELRRRLAFIPAADVVPVRHGRWLIKTIRGDKRTVCSECLLETGTCYEFSYCPNCGARMDEKF